MKIKDEDLIFGSFNERKVKLILDDIHPNDKVELNKDKFSTLDFKVTNNLGEIIHEYELKSRRIKSNTYQDLMFGENKLRHIEKKFKEKGGKYTILWLCTEDNVLLGWDWEEGTDEYTLRKGQNKKRNEKAKACVFVLRSDMYEIEHVDY